MFAYSQHSLVRSILKSVYAYVFFMNMAFFGLEEVQTTHRRSGTTRDGEPVKGPTGQRPPDGVACFFLHIISFGTEQVETTHRGKEATREGEQGKQEQDNAKQGQNVREPWISSPNRSNLGVFFSFSLIKTSSLL